MANNWGNAGSLILQGVEAGVDTYERRKERATESKERAEQAKALSTYQNEQQDLEKKRIQNTYDLALLKIKQDEDHFQAESRIKVAGLTLQADMAHARLHFDETKAQADYATTLGGRGWPKVQADQWSAQVFHAYPPESVSAPQAPVGMQQGQPAAPMAAPVSGIGGNALAGMFPQQAAQGQPSAQQGQPSAQQGQPAAQQAPVGVQQGQQPPAGPPLVDPMAKAIIDEHAARTAESIQRTRTAGIVQALHDAELKGKGIDNDIKRTKLKFENTLDPIRAKQAIAEYDKTRKQISHITDDELRAWAALPARIDVEQAEAAKLRAETAEIGPKQREAAIQRGFKAARLEAETKKKVSEATDKYVALKSLANSYHELGFLAVNSNAPRGNEIDPSKLGAVAARQFGALQKPNKQGKPGIPADHIARYARAMFPEFQQQLIAAMGALDAARVEDKEAKRYVAADKQVVHPSGKPKKKETQAAHEAAIHAQYTSAASATASATAVSKQGKGAASPANGGVPTYNQRTKKWE